MTRRSPKATAARELSLKQMAADIVRTAREVAASSGHLPSDVDHLLDQVIDQEVPNFAVALHAELVEDIPPFVAWRRRHETGFRRRNLKRWQPALDLLEAEWAVAQEASAGFFGDEHATAATEDDHLFEALITLHARALLVAREAICLIECGFPDGAMSRWRTLHEFNVIAHFLLMHGGGVARFYLGSAQFQALKRARQAREYSGLDPSAMIGQEVIEALERQCAAFHLATGVDLSDDYAWAVPQLGKRRPNLFDIEQATGRDFWRPRVRWASQHIHGAHVGSRALLGMAEAARNVAMLVGPSNGGMVDPMQMIAHSMADVSEALLSSKPDIIRRVTILVLWKFASRVGPVAMECQEAFRRRHRPEQSSKQ